MIVFLKSKDTDCGILYREDDGNRNQHNDVLGLICPFLSQYSQMFNDTSVYNLNVRQIQKYQIYGLDDNTGLPIHGFNRDFGYQVGAANWGRGIGWYALGLATIEDENLKRELKTDLFCNSIVKTELPEGGYAQYPGSSFTFDSSSTVMLRLALQQMQKTDNKDLIKIMAPYTTKDGWIDQTSGDTYGFNMYSYSFGFSELTQGLMLILLSNTDI